MGYDVSNETSAFWSAGQFFPRGDRVPEIRRMTRPLDDLVVRRNSYRAAVLIVSIVTESRKMAARIDKYLHACKSAKPGCWKIPSVSCSDRSNSIKPDANTKSH